LVKPSFQEVRMADDIQPAQWFQNFVQIGVVVADVDETVRVLSQVFGLGPFRLLDWPPAGREDLQRSYHGVPGDFTCRMAFTMIGTTELELIQPLAGDSAWADFLQQRGGGLHHIRFNVYDLEPVLSYLQSQGIGISQMGDGLRPGTVWVNLDTEKQVGFGIEVFKALAGTDGHTPKS